MHTHARDSKIDFDGADPWARDWIEVDIADCHHCRQDHRKLKAFLFRRRYYGCWRWAVCPVKGNPILLEKPQKTAKNSGQ